MPIGRAESCSVPFTACPRGRLGQEQEIEPGPLHGLKAAGHRASSYKGAQLHCVAVSPPCGTEIWLRPALGLSISRTLVGSSEIAQSLHRRTATQRSAAPLLPPPPHGATVCQVATPSPAPPVHRGSGAYWRGSLPQSPKAAPALRCPTRAPRGPAHP